MKIKMSIFPTRQGYKSGFEVSKFRVLMLMLMLTPMLRFPLYFRGVPGLIKLTSFFLGSLTTQTVSEQ